MKHVIQILTGFYLLAHLLLAHSASGSDSLSDRVKLNQYRSSSTEGKIAMVKDLREKHSSSKNRVSKNVLRYSDIYRLSASDPSSPELRNEGILALQGSANPEDLVRLAQALGDQEPVVRRNATKTLGQNLLHFSENAPIATRLDTTYGTVHSQDFVPIKVFSNMTEAHLRSWDDSVKSDMASLFNNPSIIDLLVVSSANAGLDSDLVKKYLKLCKSEQS